MLGTIISVAIAIELGLIVTQVIRGQQSHFNVSTGLDAAVYYTMGAFIAGVWVAKFVLGIVLAVCHIPDRSVATGVRWATIVGLIGMALAFLMTVGEFEVVDMDREGLAGAHSVGADDGGPGMPITGWNTESGDIRVPHFIGLHALQLIPLIVVILTLGARRSPRLRSETTRVWLVRIFAISYLGVVVIATVQAVSGQSIVGTDLPTLACLVGLIVVATIASIAVVFRRGGSGV